MYVSQSYKKNYLLTTILTQIDLQDDLSALSATFPAAHLMPANQAMGSARAGP